MFNLLSDNSEAAKVQPFTIDMMAALQIYDEKITTLKRKAIIEVQVKFLYKNIKVAYNTEGEIVGYGAVQRVQSKSFGEIVRISPLYADNAAIGKKLFASLLQEVSFFYLMSLI